MNDRNYDWNENGYRSAMQFHLNPVPPYDFFLSSRIFSSGDPEVRRFESGTFRQVLRIGGTPVLVKIISCGTVGEPSLLAEIQSVRKLYAGEVGEARRLVSSMFSLQDDLNAFYRTIAGDPPMAALSGRLFGLKAPATATVFEALVSSIIEQQISIHVARVIETRLVKRFGDPLEFQGRRYYAYPLPERLAEGSPGEFRSCGLSARKGEYSRNVASMIVRDELDLEGLRDVRENGTIIRDLCRIRGIGLWTAEFVLLRGLHRLESIPADDLGVRRAIAGTYCPGKRITGEDARRIALKWKDWKGLAAFYLLVAEQIDRETPGTTA